MFAGRALWVRPDTRREGGESHMLKEGAESMEVNFSPDTEKKLLDLAASSGRGTDDLIEDAVAGYYENILQMRQHIEEGYAQADRGELLDSDQARDDIQVLKAGWRQSHLPQ